MQWKALVQLGLPKPGESPAGLTSQTAATASSGWQTALELFGLNHDVARAQIAISHGRK